MSEKECQSNMVGEIAKWRCPSRGVRAVAVWCAYAGWWLGIANGICGGAGGVPAARAEAMSAPDGGTSLATVSLSLDEALHRAETASALVRRASAERTAVAAREVGAQLALPSNPLIAVGAGPRREQSAGMREEGIQYNIHAEQTLEIANQRGTRRTEVARAVDVAGWRETLARAETRARVRAVYIGAQLAEAQARSARTREALVQTLVDSVRTRVETGAASSVDLELARLERGRATRDRVTADLAVEVALSDLRVLIAVAPGTPLQPTSPLAMPTPPAALAVLLLRAQERRAELRILESSQGLLDAAVLRLRREAVPNPTLFLDLQRLGV